MAVALIYAPFSQLDAVMRVEIDDAVASASIQAAHEHWSEGFERRQRWKKSTFKTFFTVFHGAFDCPPVDFKCDIHTDVGVPLT